MAEEAIASWLLELNMFNSSNRGGDSRSPVGRRLPVVNTRGDGRHYDRLVFSLHYTTVNMESTVTLNALLDTNV